MLLAPQDRPNPRVKMPGVVWTLGFVSLFMDISSEMIHGLLPIFITGTLGASVVMVGLIDGVAESTASIVKVFSGYASDRLGRRKPLIVLGYGLAALSKPLFPIAHSLPVVFGARFADRIGKGIRGAPRDALIADVTPTAILGGAYGLRQALDTAGAVIGPLLAIGLMYLFADDIRSVMWMAVIPAAAAIALVWFGVRDARPEPGSTRALATLRVNDIGKLGKDFWDVVSIGVVFTLARFSEAFLILKAAAAGLPAALSPLVLVVMAIVYALGAYPAGALSDRMDERRLLLVGLVLLIAADLLLAFSAGIGNTFVAIALWGAHLAMTQGLLSKLVARHAPAPLRGSAFGVFYFASGIALLFASLIAGLLWTYFGPVATFLAGAGFATAAGARLLVKT